MLFFSRILSSLGVLSLLFSVYGHNDLFQLLCESPFLDSPSGVQNRYDKSSSTCTQKFPYVASQDLADYYCANLMPYIVAEAKSTGSQISCTWTYSGICPQGYSLQIYDNCYSFSSTCRSSKQEKVASPKLEDELRWLSRMVTSFAQFYYVKDPVIVKLNKVLEFGDNKIVKKLYENGVVFDADESKLKELNWGLILMPNRAFNARVGQVVRGKFDRFLCQRKEVKTATAGTKPFSEVDKVLDSVKAKEGRLFVTRNDYLPKIDSNGQIDLYEFHRICSRLCTECFAASGDLLKDDGKSLPAGTYWAPVAKSKSSVKLDKCGNSPSLSDRKKFQSLSHPSHSTYIPEDKEWLQVSNDLKFPKSECSDGERYAVQFANFGGKLGYVDAPIFDRKPIICFEGRPPIAKPGAGACYKNSEMNNGKCQCKAGFSDALLNEKAKIIAKAMGYQEQGYICLPPMTCSTVSSIKGFFYLADGSGSIWGKWNLVAPFANLFKNYLDKSLPVWLMQWSSPWGWCHEGRSRSSWDCTSWDPCQSGPNSLSQHSNCPSSHYEFVPPGWTEQQFGDAAGRIFGRWQNGWTKPYYFLNEIALMWRDYKQKNGLSSNDRALVVFMSDGESQDDDDVKAMAIKNFKEVNLKFLGVYEKTHEGTFDHYSVLMDNPKTDQIATPSNRAELNDHLAKKIMETACQEYSDSDVYEAI